MCNVAQHYVFLFALSHSTSVPSRDIRLPPWSVIMDKKSRQRIRRFQVLLLPAEAVAIKNHAAHCSLSVSAYLRELGLHYHPKSNVDADAVLEMVKVNGDLGRLGGLLKMWLTNKERIQPEQINGVLDKIESILIILLEKVKKL